MQPETRKYLRDMQDAASIILEVTKGRSAAEFKADRVVRGAVQWNFCVIGEALSQLKKLDGIAAAKITDHTKIIGFRNQLIHGYGVINDDITWEIVTAKLPKLAQELEQLLNS